MLFSEKKNTKNKSRSEKKNVRKNRRAIKNEQSYDTVNIGHRRHRTKRNKTQKRNITQKTKKMSKMDPTKSSSCNLFKCHDGVSIMLLFVYTLAVVFIFHLLLWFGLVDGV